MIHRPRFVAFAAATVLGVAAAPAIVVAAPNSNSTDNPGVAHRPAKTTTTDATPVSDPTPVTPPDATPGAKAKAYGKYCQGQSKKHVKGEKGTAFSRCVTAMAHLKVGDTDSPKEACKNLSKKHVKGQKGTPYSRCVSGAAKLKKDDD